jgi:ATP-dependent RNA helicase DHX8/PRP22
VFLTGREEIETCAEILRGGRSSWEAWRELTILPVYGVLPSEMQSRVFKPSSPGAHKCTIATNIDGVIYVFDPGFSKQNVDKSRMGVDSFIVTPISQTAPSSARIGRAAPRRASATASTLRTLFFRNSLLLNTMPEIQRMNLANVVLKLKTVDIKDLLGFDCKAR